MRKRVPLNIGGQFHLDGQYGAVGPLNDEVHLVKASMCAQMAHASFVLLCVHAH